MLTINAEHVLSSHGHVLRLWPSFQCVVKPGFQDHLGPHVQRCTRTGFLSHPRPSPQRNARSGLLLPPDPAPVLYWTVPTFSESNQTNLRSALRWTAPGQFPCSTPGPVLSRADPDLSPDLVSRTTPSPVSCSLPTPASCFAPDLDPSAPADPTSSFAQGPVR